MCIGICNSKRSSQACTQSKVVLFILSRALLINSTALRSPTYTIINKLFTDTNNNSLPLLCLQSCLPSSQTTNSRLSQPHFPLSQELVNLPRLTRNKQTSMCVCTCLSMTFMFTRIAYTSCFLWQQVIKLAYIAYNQLGIWRVKCAYIDIKKF